jgi:hypothetical protein
MLTKPQIIEALRQFASQRPRLDFANYGDVSVYRSELRSITRDLHDARHLLRSVELTDSITADDLIAAFKRAYSGRLSIRETENGKAELDYCTGQYWPTEYRKAVAAVCASALWDWMRDKAMPLPVYKQYGSADNRPMQTVTLYNGKSAGDYLRSQFRREFGKGIAGRWFN